MSIPPGSGLNMSGGQAASRAFPVFVHRMLPRIATQLDYEQECRIKEVCNEEGGVWFPV